MTELSLTDIAGRALVIGALCIACGTTAAADPASAKDLGASSGGSPPAATNTANGNCPPLTKDNKGNLRLMSNTANNYTFWSEIKLGQAQVAPNVDLTFEWGALDRDVFKVDMNPTTDVGNIALALFGLTIEELQEKINSDTLATQDRVIGATFETNGAVTQATTAQLTELGAPINHDVLLSYFNQADYGPPDYTYMLLVSSGTKIGKPIRMMTAFSLDASSNETVVHVNSDSSSLNYQASLDKLQPTRIPPGTAKISFDWTNMTTNAMGRTVDPFGITEILITSYDLPISELQKNENFLKLESLAKGTWSNASLAGTNAVLSTLTDPNGAAFPGIDASHTWLIALKCTDCINPAPWYLSVLTACNG